MRDKIAELGFHEKKKPRRANGRALQTSFSESTMNLLARGVKPASIPYDMIRERASARAENLVMGWLPDGRREGNEWSARNPVRADDTPGSFKVNLASGEWTDFATGDKGGDLIALCAYLDGSCQAAAALKLAAELGITIDEAAPTGLTLERYAEAKQLPVAFLRGLGLETVGDPWGNPRQVLAMPYHRVDGTLHRLRLRVAMDKPTDGSAPMLWDKREGKIGAILYGLDTLPAKGCPVILVEDESDAQTLWFHEHDAVGCPGAYSPSRDDSHLDGRDIIALVEPDAGGETLLRRLAKSRLRHRVRIAQLDRFKDVSELHCQAPERFEAVLKAAIDAARPLEAILPKSAEDYRKGEISVPAADDSEDRKPSLADQMVRLAREAATLFVAPDDTTYAAVETRGHREVWAIRSRAFRAWMVHRFFEATGRAPSEDVLSQARLTLDAIATYQGNGPCSSVPRPMKAASTSICATPTGAPSRSTPRAGASWTGRP
jgi:hypothetical protein